MNRWPTALLMIAALAVAFPAQAQPACPEGRALSGACVKSQLAQSMRKQTLVYTQPKFSYTAPALLPREDGEYYVPRDYNEIRNLFGGGLVGGGDSPNCGAARC